MDTKSPAEQDEQEAYELAVEAAGLTVEIDRHLARARELAVERADKWRRANRLGMTYATLAEIAGGLHLSQVGGALKRYPERRRTRKRAA